MKTLFGGMSVFGFAYVIYLPSQLGVITEMTSAKQECEMSTLKALQSPNTLSAEAIIAEGCARVVRDGDIAEKVLNKLP